MYHTLKLNTVNSHKLTMSVILI